MGDINKKYKITIYRLFHNFLQVIMRFLLKLVYGGPGKKMPPIKNLLLLESASSLALKIRTKKVRFFSHFFTKLHLFIILIIVNIFKNVRFIL